MFSLLRYYDILIFFKKILYFDIIISSDMTAVD